jgi:DNA-binding PadR family transcriptional regulator
MEPTRGWSRHRRHHDIPETGRSAGEHRHHAHGHPGRERFDSPRADGGGRRHHPPLGDHPGRGPGGPFGGGPFGGGPFGGSPFGGGHRGPRGGRGGGRPGRAGRGDVRTALLLLLAEQPMHGYQLMQAVAERTGGAWKLSPGAVYPTIAQLEDEGLVVVTADAGRKLVTLTEAGREHLSRLGAVDPFAAFSTEGGQPDLRALAGELMGAVGQLGRVADAAQLKQAAAVLTDARRALYLILAGQPADRDPDADEQV